MGYHRMESISVMYITLGKLKFGILKRPAETSGCLGIWPGGGLNPNARGSGMSSLSESVHHPGYLVEARHEMLSVRKTTLSV